MNIFKVLFDRKRVSIEKRSLPVHIAIIMDGNGRWAKKRGLPRNIGHREGSNTLKKIVTVCSEIGIKYLTVYAFSTENWKRPKDEVDMLMGLLMEYLKKADQELKGQNIRISIIGDKSRLTQEMQKEIERIEKSTLVNKGLHLNIALNYGGRDEILSAIKKIAIEYKQGNLSLEEISEEKLTSNLYTADMPEPDLVIRTSGEKRLSNFLLWQTAYSEFCFTDVLWPDFKKEHILEAINDYQNRNRRFGGI